jgi:hypothetical protein
MRFTMRRMKTGGAVGLMLASCLILGEGCDQRGAREAVHLGVNGSQQVAAPRPTIDEAKQALLTWLRFTGTKQLVRTDAEELSRRAEEPAGRDGTWQWGPFLIDLPGNRFTYIISRGKRCSPEYGGRFEVRGGLWVATHGLP